MGRSVAILISLLIGLWLMTPAFAAPSEELHECCRKAGKHHCSMGKTRSDGPAFNKSGCPEFQWHGASMVPQSPDIAQPGVSLAPAETTQQHFFSANNSPQSPGTRNAQTRGPPVARL